MRCGDTSGLGAEPTLCGLSRNVPLQPRHASFIGGGGSSNSSSGRCWRRCAGPRPGEQPGSRQSARLLFEIDVGERLPVIVADDQAGVGLLERTGAAFSAESSTSITPKRQTPASAHRRSGPRSCHPSIVQLTPALRFIAAPVIFHSKAPKTASPRAMITSCSLFPQRSCCRWIDLCERRLKCSAMGAPRRRSGSSATRCATVARGEPASGLVLHELVQFLHQKIAA